MGKVSVTFNVHNERLTPAQFLDLENRILADVAEAKAFPHRLSVNLVGDLNVPPPGSAKRQLDKPSAEGPAAAEPELHCHRPYYHRWACIFSQLTEIDTDVHTHITTGTLTTDTLDRMFTSLPKSSGNHLDQSAAVLNSPMHFLAKRISDHAPLIWTISQKKPASKGSFSARPEWIKHLVFLENATLMADAVNFDTLSLEHQKECITII